MYINLLFGWCVFSLPLDFVCEYESSNEVGVFLVTKWFRKSDLKKIKLAFYVVVGQRQSSMMPFTLEELVILSRCLRDACLGIIKLAYPETKPEVREEYIAAFRSVGVTKNTEMQQCIQTEQKRWIQLFKVNCVNFQNVFK